LRVGEGLVEGGMLPGSVVSEHILVENFEIAVVEAGIGRRFDVRNVGGRIRGIRRLDGGAVLFWGHGWAWLSEYLILSEGQK
jgi:hypothetical protein